MKVIEYFSNSLSSWQCKWILPVAVDDEVQRDTTLLKVKNLFELVIFSKFFNFYFSFKIFFTASFGAIFFHHFLELYSNNVKLCRR